jgi:selT/selW/selH-like putative selenoprotein
VSLAAQIKRKHGVDAVLVPGKSGEFTVLVDGATLWDKFESHRFPEHDEILSQMR